MWVCLCGFTSMAHAACYTSNCVVQDNESSRRIVIDVCRLRYM
jgi:hypothetical protein